MNISTDNNTVIIYRDLNKKNSFIPNLIDYLNYSKDFNRKYTILKKSSKENLYIKFDESLQVKKFILLFKLITKN